MHEAPPRIGRRVLEQPRHRAPAAPRDAVVHFLALLGGVNVDRRAPVDRADSGDEGCELRRAHRAQGVRGDAHAQIRAGLGAGALHDLEDALGRAREPRLCGTQLGGAEPAVRVERREQREGNAGLARGAHVRKRHLGRIGVGRAVGRMVDVMKLGHGGVAVLEQLHIELSGDGVRVLRAEPSDEAVHRLAPRPEAVSAGRAALLREPRHGALERVRVNVRHPGDERSGCAWRPVGACARRHAYDCSGRIDFEQDVARPALGQQRARGEEACRHCAGKDSAISIRF
jgi:hypothetical protein